MRRNHLLKVLIIVAVILLVLFVFSKAREGRLGKGFKNQDNSARVIIPDNKTNTQNSTTQSSTVPLRVVKMTEIKAGGVKDMDWHHGKNLIAYGKLSASDMYYDVYTMKPDGSGEKCVTCGASGVPQKHNGNQVWHPSGEWIIFTAERADAPSEYDDFAIPGSGYFGDLWAIKPDGSQAVKLTDYSSQIPVRAVIHPQFSHSGTRLMWAEKTMKGTSFDGGWVLKFADFSTAGTPSLSKIETLNPGSCGTNCFYESHAFSKDDKKVLFSGNLENQIPYGLDIYEYTFSSKTLKNLTKSPIYWDEHAHYSLDEKYITMMASDSFNIDWSAVPSREHFKFLKTELFIMNRDGSGRKQLTYFNTSTAPEYLGGKAIVSDSSWGPDGKSLAMLVAYDNALGKSNSKMYIVELGQ